MQLKTAVRGDYFKRRGLDLHGNAVACTHGPVGRGGLQYPASGNIVPFQTGRDINGFIAESVLLYT